MLIEVANVDDAHEILLLQRLAYQSEAKIYNDSAIPPLTETLDQLTLLFVSHIFLKATVDDKIVGSVRACMNDGTCHIGRLIVAPKFQNQGLGKRLLSEIEQKFPACKRFELFTGIKSVRNIHMYKKAGYHAFKTQVVSSTLSLVCFEKVK